MSKDGPLPLAPLLLAPPKIISGGQTGVDRAALDAAGTFGFPHGGWCPRGRKSTNGRIPDHYPLQETSSARYDQRTRKNIEEADAVLVIHFGPPTGGTALTLEISRRLGKPFLGIDLAVENPDHALLECRNWLKFRQPQILNIAGPRDNSEGTIHKAALSFLTRLFALYSQKIPPTGAENSLEASGFKSWPEFAADEIEAALEVLRSGRVNYWTGGQGIAFERDFARWTGARYAVALANGTLALEAALYALDIAPGDEVIVPCRSYVASASSVCIRGATPVFADVDPQSQNITVETIRRVQTSRTRAVIVVHLAGWPCNMDPIMQWAKVHDVAVIEDCAQALGAAYRGRAVGTIGDIGAFSFCQDKIMTTGGEGGMLTTNSAMIWEKVWSMKDHGREYDAVFHRRHPPGFRWLNHSFGTNWRMTEMQAAIGRVALPKVDGWVSRRRAHAEFLNTHLSGFSCLQIPEPPLDVTHAFYKYYLFIRPDSLKKGWNRDHLVEELNQAGIACIAGSCSEIYREKSFVEAGFSPRRRLPTGRRLGETSLMFQIHHTLPTSYLEHIVTTLTKILKKACR